ncbi:MAG: hypothetical protein LBT75_01225 [Bacilli bacterium]|jgi:hypothetical protein|nr:hypothetical protein [Bacilli bacterium]
MKQMTLLGSIVKELEFEDDYYSSLLMITNDREQELEIMIFFPEEIGEKIIEHFEMGMYVLISASFEFRTNEEDLSLFLIVNDFNIIG